MKKGDSITDKNNQLIVATGPKGSGKTDFALSFLPPSKVDRLAVADSENSSNKFRSDINSMGKDFGLYINTMERFKGLPSDDDLLSRIAGGNAPWVGAAEQSAFIDYFKYIVNELNQIPRNKYDCLVIDTGEKLESGMAAWVEANKKKFGITDTGYGKIWSNGVFPLYANLLQGIYDRGISTVIMTFHLKNVWQDKRPVAGKVNHAGKKILYQLSSFMVWLVNDSRNPNGEPAGLVLKDRLGKHGIDEANDRWTIRTMIPRRIPVCTWEEIRRYMIEGYDISNPKSTEVRSDQENDMISELLNDAQLRLMLQDSEIEREQNAIIMAEAGILPTISQEVVTIGAENGTPQTKAEAITKWKTLGRPVPALLKKLREKGIEDEAIGERWSEVVDG